MSSFVRRTVWVPLFCLLAVPVVAEGPKPGTFEAYTQYVSEVRRAFLASDHTGATPAREGTIRKVPNGLIHHWAGSVEIPGVCLDDVLAVARDYDHYAGIHTPVLRSRLLDREGNTYRIQMRMKSDAGILSAVLDVWSVVTYLPAGNGMRVLSETRQIRQIDSETQPAGAMPDGVEESHYFWAANTFTSFEPVAGGVRVELETLGLSRRFPPLLGWIVEPLARRLGRSSAERTLEEFRAAVLARHRQLITGAIQPRQ